MKTTKYARIILIFLMTFGYANIHAQFLKKLGEKAQKAVERGVERTVENRAEKTASQKTDEAIDVATGKNSSKSKKSKNSGTDTSDNNISITKSSDFVPGANMIFTDDFSKDATGDFPAKWNSTGNGEIVEISGKKWLSLNHNTATNPELTKALPENCTIQFDLLLRSESGKSIPYIKFGLTKAKNILKEDVSRGDFYVSLIRYNENNGQEVSYGTSRNQIGVSDFKLVSYTNKVLHVDIAINGTRARVYLNGNKVVDLPRVLTSELRNNFYIKNEYVVPASQTAVYFTNLRIASGSADARSSVAKDLFEKGSASTSDILFDSGKATIKQSSFSILNDLGNALKQNSNSQIIIIGHTDSDGDEKTNQILSEQRAASVKDYLVSKFGIDASKILTTGKGESEPIGSNSTEDGKKQNRRVEFKKL